MAERDQPAIRALDLPARTTSIYPPAFVKPLEGRAKRALGDAFGLTQFGVNYTTLAPGAASAERHWHAIEDEFVFVLEGEITLVDDTGERLLTPGMCAGFRSGVANAHKLVNRSGAPAAYLEVGTRSATESVDYPDVDMKATKIGGKFTFTHKDGTPY